MAAILRGSRNLGVVLPIGALLAALAAGGCSTFQDFAGVQHAGYQNDGTYVLSAQDKDLGCGHLQERSDGLIAQMQALPARAVQELQDAPKSLAAMFSRTFGGGGNGLKAVDAYDRTHAEAVALNAYLDEKGCGSTDVDAHLGESKEQMVFFKR